MMTMRWRKVVRRLKALTLLALTVVSFMLAVTPRSTQACGRLGLGLAPKCWGSEAGKEAIKQAQKEDFGVEFGIKPDTVELLTAFMGFTKAQAVAVINAFGEEFQETAEEALDRVEDTSAIITGLGKDFMTHSVTEVDEATKARLDQMFAGLVEVSDNLTELIIAGSDAVEDTGSTLLEKAGLEGRTTIISAKDALAELLNITTKQVDFLLSRSAEEVAIILSQFSDEMAALIELSSEEAQEIIRVGGEESERVLNSVIENFNGELRITLQDLEGGVIRATDNASEETQEVTAKVSEELQVVIETAAENTSLLISETSEEVQKIANLIRDNRIQVIDRGAEVALFVVNRVADLIIIVFSVAAGFIFFFIASFGWGTSWMKYHKKIPQKSYVLVLIFTLMGTTFLGALSPFAVAVFPSVRAQVLMPASQTQKWEDALGPAPSIPNSPEITGTEPEVISIQKLVSTESVSMSRYLRVYGQGLGGRGKVTAKFGDIDLPVHGVGNYFLMVNLSPILDNPGGSTEIDIVFPDGEIDSIPVNNDFESNAFQRALIKAEQAQSLTESADSSDDWSDIANLWEEAIGALKSVEKYSKDYESAQQNITEYESFMEHANGKKKTLFDDEKVKQENDEKVKQENDEKVKQERRQQQQNQIQDWTARFPMQTCGDEDLPGIQTWYPIYTSYSESNLERIRKSYCRDAFMNLREEVNIRSIQVASFMDPERAELFASMMREKVGSGEVGEVTRR